MIFLLSRLAKRARPYDVKTLYKYRSFKSEALEDIFTKQEIFLPNYELFNDPFDCHPILNTSQRMRRKKKFLRELISRQMPSYTSSEIEEEINEKIGSTDLFNPDMLEIIFHSSFAEYGVYSMSEVNDDILMWSHYSNGHTGISLGFNSNDINSIFFQCMKVKYRRRRPRIDPLRMGDTDALFEGFFVKSRQWKYEKEWRLVMAEVEGGSGPHKFRPEHLTSVTLGSEIEDVNEKLVWGWIDKYPTSLKVYRAEKSDSRFKVSIVPTKPKS